MDVVCVDTHTRRTLYETGVEYVPYTASFIRTLDARSGYGRYAQKICWPQKNSKDTLKRKAQKNKRGAQRYIPHTDTPQEFLDKWEQRIAAAMGTVVVRSTGKQHIINVVWALIT